eukprot:scaffold46317_cov70-Phaeocystis_antarctica.AAC.1
MGSRRPSIAVPGSQHLGIRRRHHYYPPNVSGTPTLGLYQPRALCAVAPHLLPGLKSCVAPTYTSTPDTARRYRECLARNRRLPAGVRVPCPALGRCQSGQQRYMQKCAEARGANEDIVLTLTLTLT